MLKTLLYGIIFAITLYCLEILGYREEDWLASLGYQHPNTKQYVPICQGVLVNEGNLYKERLILTTRDCAYEVTHQRGAPKAKLAGTITMNLAKRMESIGSNSDPLLAFLFLEEGAMRRGIDLPDRDIDHRSMYIVEWKSIEEGFLTVVDPRKLPIISSEISDIAEMDFINFVHVYSNDDMQPRPDLRGAPIYVQDNPFTLVGLHHQSQCKFEQVHVQSPSEIEHPGQCLRQYAKVFPHMDSIKSTIEELEPKNVVEELESKNTPQSKKKEKSKEKSGFATLLKTITRKKH